MGTKENKQNSDETKIAETQQGRQWNLADSTLSYVDDRQMKTNEICMQNGNQIKVKGQKRKCLQ
jgi:hypothetical protein